VLVYLDSNMVIYFVEKNPTWGPKINSRLSALQSAGDDVAVSDAKVCERAAHIRAIHKYPSLDALHLAAAAEHGCSLVLTNDLRLKGFADVPVEILS
jgi:predicted nucleic acid-binding protein